MKIFCKLNDAFDEIITKQSLGGGGGAHPSIPDSTSAMGLLENQRLARLESKQL